MSGRRVHVLHVHGSGVIVTGDGQRNTETSNHWAAALDGEGLHDRTIDPTPSFASRCVDALQVLLILATPTNYSGRVNR